MSGWTVIFVMLISIGVGSGGWFVTPKGPNQVLIRTMALLTITCCYVMWAVLYLSQLHPIISPQRSDVRFLEQKAL